MDINIRPYQFRCTCGMPRSLVQVAVTSRGDMAFSWMCEKCGETVSARLPIADIIADIPSSPQKLIAPPSWNEEDTKYLAEMQISLEGE